MLLGFFDDKTLQQCNRTLHMGGLVLKSRYSIQFRHGLLQSWE